jgi:hypothetical protein
VPRTRRTRSGRHGGVIFKLLVLLAVVFAGAALAWMLFLPLVLTAQLQQRTGFAATVESLAVNPFTGTVELRGLVLRNPPGFPVRDFVRLREFSAVAEVFSLLSDRPVFTSIRLDLADITLVKREDGRTNAEAFQGKPGPAAAAGAEPPAARPPRRFLIRRLSVRVDRLVIADHSARPPVVHEYPLGLDQTYRDVTDVKQLFAPAVLQSLAPVGAVLNGLVPGDLGRALNGAVKGAAKAGEGWLKAAGRKAGEKAKEYLDALEESGKP